MSKKEKTYEELKGNVCTCDHPEESGELHGCLFQIEIHEDSEYECACCEFCKEQCAMDI